MVSTIGLDLAKKVFQVHGVDAAGTVTVRRTLRRRLRHGALLGARADQARPRRASDPARLRQGLRAPGQERCGGRGRDLRGGEPAVNPLVAVKSEAQQAAAELHKLRALLIKQRTMVINQLRGLMAEFGIVVAKGPHHVGELAAVLVDPAATRIPAPLGDALVPMAELWHDLERRIAAIDQQILDWGRTNATCRHLITIPGFGRSWRAPWRRSWSIPGPAAAAGTSPLRAVWCRARLPGLPGPTAVVGPEREAGGKVKLGPISKRGNGYLRRLLVNGAMAVLSTRRARQDAWLGRRLATKARKVAPCALANKMARIAWAVMMRQEDFRTRSAVA